MALSQMLGRGEGLLHSFSFTCRLRKTMLLCMNGVKSPCGAHWNQVFLSFH